MIDEVKCDEDNFEFFYPNLHKQRQADFNLSKCLRNIR